MNNHNRMSYFILPFGAIAIFIVIITICFKIISSEIKAVKVFSPPLFGFYSPYMDKAHLFHGVLYSQCKKGEWSFIRDGKECGVFNEQYKKD